MVRQPLHGQQRVVGLNDDVSRVVVGEDGVGLDELLGEAIVESFEEERTETRSCSSGDGVKKHETLE